MQFLEPDSVPNSQGSSFNDSTASQTSPQRPTSGDKSQFFAGHYLSRPITPSTSSSNPSSQERAEERLKGILILQGDAQRQPHNAQNERPRSLDVGGLNGENTHAPKRTADGRVKIADLEMPTSPVDFSHFQRHSRNDSNVSKGSQIGEVCSLVTVVVVEGSSLCPTSCPIISRPDFPTLWSRSRTAGRPAALMSLNA